MPKALPNSGAVPPQNTAPNLRLALTFCALAAAIMGAVFLQIWPPAGWALFLAAGLGLDLLAPESPAMGALNNFPGSRPGPLSVALPGAVLGTDKGAKTRAGAGSGRGIAREALFLAFLLAFSLGTRLYRLDLYPAGPGFVESVMSLDAEALAKAPYTPHVTEPQANFPSLVFYQGLGAAQALGWKIQNLRIPSALWGALSVLALYFLLRQFCSPFAAGLFSLLYSVNNLHLTLSRLFFPATPLLFSAAATAALLLLGLRKGGKLPFLAAGLACGLALHGYIPGRLLPPFFLAWLAWQVWEAKRNGRSGPGILDLLLFSGGCLAMGAPVLLWALSHRSEYMALVEHNGGGPWDSLRAYFNALPDYLQMFHLKADGILEPTDGLALFPVLRPDGLDQVLLPLGLLACLCSFWRPVPALIVGGFFLGILPAAVAGNYPHPCTRRALLVLPWAYAASALAWDRLQAALEHWGGGPRLKKGLACAAVLACTLALAASLRQYFVEIMGRPSLRSAYNVTASELGQEFAYAQGAEVKLSYDLAEPNSCTLIFDKDMGNRSLKDFQNFDVLDRSNWPSVTALKQFEDFLVFRDPGPRLLLMAPYLLPAKDLLKTLFPDGQALVYQEERDFRSGTPPWDPYEPFVHLVRYSIPAKDVEAFKGMVDLNAPPYAAGGRLATQAADFADARRGRPLRLGCVLVAPSPDTLTRFSLPWPGWRLKVDAQASPWGRDLTLAPGSHTVELSGRVPALASGPLPLTVLENGQDSRSLGRLLPLDPRYGMRLTLSPWAGGPASATVSRFEPLPLHRFWPPEGLPLPWRAVFSSVLKVPQDGPLWLRMRLPYRGRILVDGIRAFDSLDQVNQSLKLDLKAGVPHALSVECSVDSQRDHERTLVLDQKGSLDGAWTPLPFTWLRTPGLDK